MRRINNEYKTSNTLIAEDYEASKVAISTLVDQLNKQTHLYKDYFIQMGTFLLEMMAHDEALKEESYFLQSFEVLQENNQALYKDILEDRYETSYVNPSFACLTYGEEMGHFLSSVAYKLRIYVGLVYESRYFDMHHLNQLYISLYEAMVDQNETKIDVLVDLVKGHNLKDLEQRLKHQWLRNASPRFDVYSHIVDAYDLTDLNYLFRYGVFIGSNEIIQAKHVLGLTEEKQQRIADTYTEAYIRGFKRKGIPLEHKKSVSVTYHVGFETIMKKAFANFREIGLEPFAFYSLKGARRPRLYTTKPNKQMEYDHRFSDGIFLDDAYVGAYIQALEKVLESYKEDLQGYSGLALFEVFGEEAFTPVNHEANMTYDTIATQLSAKLSRETNLVYRKYVPGDAYSFTINDYPLPSIGKDYEAIFEATISLNTLEEPVYEKIQATMIDALDQCQYVSVTGRAGNETNMRVSLYPLTDPETQTIFDNCTADVNVPVGEVYTSPVLAGTEGLLHVQKVFLTGFEYKDLKIWFKDGMIVDYTCSNFDTEDANRNFVHETLIHPHETLPLGEFAIGTNTVAYMMAKKFDIQDKLPILIGEKTGPHFAIGDTCFKMSEDSPVYNSNGKEVVARDNEKTCQRFDNVEEAYTYKHTDITIPYNELDTIIGYNKDGRAFELIRNGRFVLKGTELLNQPFDEE